MSSLSCWWKWAVWVIWWNEQPAMWWVSSWLWGGVVAHKTLLSAPFPIGIGNRGLGLGLENNMTTDLQVVWIDEGWVDPASVDLTKVPAEALEVTEVTQRLLHQVKVRNNIRRTAGHEEEDQEQLSPGACQHHHWSSSPHHHHHHHHHIIVTNAPHGVTLGSWLAALQSRLLSINCIVSVTLTILRDTR